MSNNPNRIEVVPFKKPNSAELRRLWNPIFPPFDPIIDLSEITLITCSRHFFYKNIIGLDPFEKINYFIHPNTDYKYYNYYDDSKEYRRAIIEILKGLVWEDNLNFLVNQDPITSSAWEHYVRYVLKKDKLNLTNRILQFLGRLYDNNLLINYPSYKQNIFFHLHIFNPKIYINPNNQNRIFELQTLPTERNPNQTVYRWNDSFPAFADVQEINLERREIVLYWYYSSEFIPQTIRESDNFINRELDFFINPLLHYLWSIRLCLVNLQETYKNDFKIKYLYDNIYEPIQYIFPSGEEFIDFNLRLETLDRTYTQNDITFDPETLLAQSLIIQKLSQRHDPWRALSFERYCTPRQPRDQLCNVNWACSMKDFIVLPKPRVAQNVRIFQKALRDEITLACKNFYFLERFIFKDTQEYRRHLTFWLGDIAYDGSSYSYIDFENPIYNRAPREKRLSCIFLTPFIYPMDYQIKLIDQESNTIIEVLDQNQSILHIKNLISPNHSLRVMVGKFPKIKSIKLLKEEQDNLWRACNFKSSDDIEEEFQDDVPGKVRAYLIRSLKKNQKRAGEAIFGDRVHFY